MNQKIIDKMNNTSFIDNLNFKIPLSLIVLSYFHLTIKIY